MLCYPDVTYESFDSLQAIQNIEYSNQVSIGGLWVPNTYFFALVKNTGEVPITVSLKDSTGTSLLTQVLHYNGEMCNDGLNLSTGEMDAEYESFGYNLLFIPSVNNGTTEKRITLNAEDLSNIEIKYMNSFLRNNAIISGASENGYYWNGRYYMKTNLGEALCLLHVDQSERNWTTLNLLATTYEKAQQHSSYNHASINPIGPFSYNNKTYYVSTSTTSWEANAESFTNLNNASFYNHIVCGKMHDNEIFKILCELTELFPLEEDGD